MRSRGQGAAVEMGVRTGNLGKGGRRRIRSRFWFTGVSISALWMKLKKMEEVDTNMWCFAAVGEHALCTK
jgi:hypothetical protein